MIIVRWPDNNFFVSVVAFESSEYLMTSSGGQVECDCCRVCDESCKKDEEPGGKIFLSQLAQLKMLLPSPQALVHVSTAYVNTELSQVTQKFLGIKM